MSILNKLSYTIKKILIVSDLHIDQWSNKLTMKYPCGKISHYPLNKQLFINKTDYLIIAGDISDNIDLSLQYLNSISFYFEKILFIDGNHEHVEYYPNLLSHTQIQDKIKKNNNDAIHYLSNSPFIINKTAVIGCCGWWNYNNDTTTINDNINNYFKDWIPLTKKQSTLFTENVIKRSKTELKYIKDYINKYNNDTSIESIIIVTHTVPIDILCDEHKFDSLGNHQMYDQIINNHTFNKKIKYWIYGHTHGHTKTVKINGIDFIQNSRGRPDDDESLSFLHDRINYTPLQISL